MKEHTIPFTGLKDGAHEFNYVLNDPFFAATTDDEFEGGEVNMRVDLVKTPTTMVAHLHADGQVRVHCDRCNTLMAQPVIGDQQQIFHLNGHGHFEGDDDDEVVGLDASASEINLTHFFYECVRLALPIRHVHPEGQCDPEVEQALNALPEPGPEAAPDPRWAALNALKKKK